MSYRKTKSEGTEMFTDPDYTDIVWALECHYVLSVHTKLFSLCDSGVPREGGFGVFKTPLQILKALQNRAKLNPIVKTVKNCRI